ncbi:RICIN domain-containing protein [Streptomyces lancefieldiae]|uniref:XRE family transcriptional regulator n=1 Tax=Streptomyces lancefieldiae TaxID=3075520 RepID=A0ABU3AG29_9ACTN|nr:XRE family transcriptional regulator [Streptomyces sp. DSM 40712]MDT0609131.1 XRE family transcriptional regulator [Streptomyces sp. DSM 40712]
MGSLGELSPHEAGDAGGFVESMQQLKERSGLTYRDLEERAARNGDVLPRSTLADMLRRTSLPRPELLAAFVRACGDAQRVGAWLDARNRIAADTAATRAAEPGTVSGAPAEAGPRPETDAEEATVARPRRATGRRVALMASLVVPVLALTAWGLFPDSSAGPAVDPGAPTDGWITVRPARAPDLCLTDGRDRRGAYDTAIAVQLPCSQAPVPRTYLESTGEDLYRLQWHHPREGKGCLTVMNTGPAKDMLEPRNDCARATLFHVESAEADGAEGFRLRPADSGRCVGIVDDDTTEGAEAIEERCTGSADQLFLLREG